MKCKIEGERERGGDCGEVKVRACLLLNVQLHKGFFHYRQRIVCGKFYLFTRALQHFFSSQ